ncbi:type II and III secretion system protein family protein [Variovorax sp. PAMC 28711]|uniref:type II and III secretion system protein family protein n=1 Tax=Variovorax sp. PAMC 28711 TaxID=1795631 RepID=UPI00143C4B1F|nr:pilus assembly protein N-terminal domain-containing protein [Variovorax sp. PAMC 28711]
MAAFIAACPLPALSQAAPADATLRMYVGETQTIRMPSEVMRIAIGNGKVMSASTLNAREVLLVANDAGESRLTIWLKDKTQRTQTVYVTLSNMARISSEVHQLFFNDPNVSVRTVGERIFLEASDLSALQAKKVSALEKAYPQQFVAIIGGEGNLQERTIYMNAEIVEIRKSALENLGIQWQQAINGPAADVAASAEIRGGRARTVNPFLWTIGLASAITSRINLLEQRGDAYVIATPQLTSRCGGTADFTAGGELPIPIASGPGQIAVEFKPYGIRLQIEPRCDTQGNIRAKLGIELSQIDRSVTVLGVPGLLTRKAITELDLVDGRSMLVSGLTSLRVNDEIDQVPGVGDVPLLGNLFRNKNLGGERTELVLLITPAVVTNESPQITRSLERGRNLQTEAIDRLRSRIKEQAPQGTPGALPADGGIR